MSSMVQRTERYAKTLAIDLRKKGFSYSEIKKSIFVPKSTLSSWLKKLKLTEEQKEKLKKKRLEAAKAGSAKKMLKTKQAIEEIKNSSAKDILKISNRELWLIGIVLYWKERLSLNNINDLRKGVQFTNADPHLVKIFLKWLRDIGRIKDKEIMFDIFAKEEKKNVINELIEYWSKVTNFPKECFSRTYFQKIRSKKRGVKKRIISKRADFGMLRIRVSASSMLARQIAGWVKGVGNIISQ